MLIPLLVLRSLTLLETLLVDVCLSLVTSSGWKVQPSSISASRFRMSSSSLTRFCLSASAVLVGTSSPANPLFAASSFDLDEISGYRVWHSSDYLEVELGRGRDVLPMCRSAHV